MEHSADICQVHFIYDIIQFQSFFADIYIFFGLDDLFTGDRGILKSLTTTVLGSIYVSKSNSVFFIIIHLFICAYIVWVIFPPCHPLPPSTPFPPQFQEGPVLPLSLVLLKKRNKHNKEDKVFLIVKYV
jgi:hypothetical protein